MDSILESKEMSAPVSTAGQKAQPPPNNSEATSAPRVRVSTADSRNSSSSNGSESSEVELKYGTRHVILLFIPVSLCMAVVIATMNTVGYYRQKDVYL